VSSLVVWSGLGCSLDLVELRVLSGAGAVDHLTEPSSKPRPGLPGTLGTGPR
jgi:hypothetical protein